MTTNPQSEVNIFGDALHMALELSSTKWKLGFADRMGRKPRIRSIDAGDFDQLKAEIARAKKVLGLSADAQLISCYEAGRDGFWIHRCLVAMGVESYIVEPASIQVNRRRRRAKTDRIDAEKIVNALMRFKSGDRLACRMIRIPGAEDEDARNLNRELETIKKEKTAHTNRIKSLLVAQGVSQVIINRNFACLLEDLQTADGNPLSSYLQQRLLREFERLTVAVEQIRELQMQQATMLREAAVQVAQANAAEIKASRQAQIALQLQQLLGIGPVSSWTLATEVFAWRDINNRRQLGALAGLTPTPNSSGNEEKEQGISKSGRAALRKLMIEIAWGWLRYQPQTALSKWYQNRFADGTKRNRKIGIVALARKLLVALGKYVRSGEIPQGAKFSDEMKFSYQVSLRPVSC